MNNDDKPSRMKYVWPWLVMATVAATLIAAFAD
jgi:hypothetical protein